MRNRYAAVARTYPLRVFSGGLAAMWMMILTVMVIIPFLVRYDSRRTSLPFNYLLMPAAFFIGALAIHLKQLLIDAKSRVLPRPTRAALVVTGGFAAAYFIGLPLLMNLRGGVPLLWSAALLWMWCAAVFHFAIRPSLPTGTITGLVYGLSLMNPSPLKTWLVAADDPLVAWLLLLVSVVWFVIVTRWLLQMNEESPGYTALSSGQVAWKARDTSTEQTNRPWQDPGRSWGLRFNSPGERQMDRLVRYSGSANILVRCRRWQVEGMQPYLPFVFLMVAMSIASAFEGGGVASHSSLFTVAMWAVIVAIMGPGGRRLEQWRMIANDFVKPIRREDYFREMGLCLAIDMARNLAVVLVIILGFTLLMSPGDFRPALVLPCLLVIALAGIFVFGAIVWLMRYRSPLALAAPIFVLIFPYVMLAMISRIPSMRWVAPCTAAILALIGLWLARDAYRRWLLTDLG